MSYYVQGSDMLQWFYPTSAPHNINKASTTNFRINNFDISNSYVGIGTNSNIPVSQIYPNINYLFNGNSIGNLFELNLPVLSGTINTDFKIFPVINGTVIQILKSTSLRFNYNVNCDFTMIGGGGPGGNQADSNAGGGGGAGELITGSIKSLTKGDSLAITIGAGGTISYGGITTIKNSNASITANGGGFGGNGKTSTNDVTGSSSGGTGSWSNSSPTVGTAFQQIEADTANFKSMISYNNAGSRGNEQNNDSGGGGGGGGAGGAGITTDNNNPGTGGGGIAIQYGSISFTIGGGGGGGGRSDNTGSLSNGGLGGLGGGGKGGGPSTNSSGDGNDGSVNTGGGGGGASNDGGGSGGKGGSGTVIFYILASGVS
jgi:hypothetical protein